MSLGSLLKEKDGSSFYKKNKIKLGGGGARL